MKRLVLVAMLLVLAVVGAAFAQESEANLFGNWFIDDAIPVEKGQLDLRLYTAFTIESSRAALGTDDDVFFSHGAVWGPCDRVEVASWQPINLGDGDRTGDGLDGNGDHYFSILYQINAEAGLLPAIAVRGAMRVPTGRDSDGVDGELRLLMTKAYASGLRSHVNAFGATINGNNDPAARSFQWGLVVGMDGPLCADGAVRWVADYMHRSSEHFGRRNMNLLEMGAEWTISDAHGIALGVQVGLDDNDDTPDFGGGIAYSFAIPR